MSKRIPPVKHHYCDKGEMLAELRAYQATGVISEKLGTMFMNIAVRATTKPNFSRYPDRMDYISESVKRMIEKIDKFNPDHPKANPFHYFSQIVKRKFIAEICRMQKRVRTHAKLAEMAMDEFETEYGGRKNKSSRNIERSP
jgi:DNA-directed RNA polymerase specialized sigma24 family protein